ncbi:MAG: type II CAAX endopeptidase family protein [Solirubrobacterales bacterium]
MALLVALSAQVFFAVPVAIVDGGAEEEFSTGASVVLQLLGALIFVLVSFAVASMRGADLRLALWRLGVQRFRASAWLWMLAAIGAYLLFAILYVALVGEPEQEDIAEAFGPVPVQILLIVLAASVSEEICFRGMLFGGLRERLPRWPAALISASVFGALHAFTGVSAVPPLIAFGVIMALLYERTGSIVPGIILHMLNNSAALAAQ